MDNQSLVEKWRVAEAKLAELHKTNSLYPHMREIGDRLAYTAVSAERVNPLMDKDRDEVRLMGRAAGRYLSGVKANSLQYTDRPRGGEDVVEARFREAKLLVTSESNSFPGNDNDKTQLDRQRRAFRLVVSGAFRQFPDKQKIEGLLVEASEFAGKVERGEITVSGCEPIDKELWVDSRRVEGIAQRWRQEVAAANISRPTNDLSSGMRM